MLGERGVCLYLRTRSDNFSPVPSTAVRSLPGWGQLERCSPQIFCNKVRLSDLQEVTAPRVTEIPSPPTRGSTEPSVRVFLGHSERT